MTASPDTTAKKPGLALWLPLGLFGAFFVLVMFGLFRPASRDISSQMIGQPLPAFDLPKIAADRPGLTAAAFKDGKPKLLNVFASWCVPCAAESPQLEELSRSGVTVQGVAIRDRPEDLAIFLARNGNPYAAIGSDPTSALQLAIGSSGVPESFVIDGKGVIRYQHIGVIGPQDMDTLRQKLAEAAK
ncbi:MAG: DsbE family thiol:disulfide interchange protein [Novosphingobium sp.]|jgi:cytochrome c biogenesis protein CcmG/thiol:disulfide interchange protein DsbE